MRWFTGPTLPPLGAQEIVWWEDTTANDAKIAMRRGGQIYVFSSYSWNPAQTQTIALANHAHRHATGDSILADVAADPITPYTFNWANAHTYTPPAAVTPITIQAATGQSVPLFRIKAPI
jgi:hypothetical protein